MEIPTIDIPVFEVDTVDIPLPKAEVPYYVPMVVPPSDLKEPEDTKPVQTETPPAPTLKLPPLPVSYTHMTLQTICSV